MTVRSILVRLVIVSLGAATLMAQDARPAPRFRFERPVDIGCRARSACVRMWRCSPARLA